MAKTAKQYLDDHKRLEEGRTMWKNHWQLAAEYVHQRRADFTVSREPGAFISSKLWTDDPTHMAETGASAFLGYVWGGGSKSFRLTPNQRLFAKDDEVARWFADATEDLQEEMDDQEAGFDAALDESTLDLFVLGTDAILMDERNKDMPHLGAFIFEPWSVLEFALDEDAAGKPVRFYREREYTIGQLVSRYGIENVSKKSAEAFTKGKKDDKVRVVHAIEPRDEKDRKNGSKAAKDMPIASVHIECEAKHILLDSGYPELPVACSRLSKRIKERYGRGRGMNALPSIMMLNQIWEDLMLAEEKKLDPPMYALHDAVVGNGIVDTSAGGLTILRLDRAQPNTSPVGKLFDIEDTTHAMEIIQSLKDSISNHFMIDRLINMNNDREMTAREALLRNAIRQGALRSVVSRVLMEKFEPLINRGFMILLRRGRFGYMPNSPEAEAAKLRGEEVRLIPEKIVQAMQSGKNLYSVEYLTQAARDLMAEEGQGMMETLQMAAELAKVDQSVSTMVDSHFTLTRMAEIRGAQVKMFRSADEVKQIEEAKAQQAQAAQQAQMAQAGAGVAKDMAMAQNAMTQ